MNTHGFGSPPTQRRLRHLKCIIIRNLLHDPNSPSLGAFYYTLHVHSRAIEAIERMHDTVLYFSNVDASPENAVDIDRINLPTTPDPPRHGMNGITPKSSYTNNTNLNTLSTDTYNTTPEPGHSPHNRPTRQTNNENLNNTETTTDPECNNSNNNINKSNTNNDDPDSEEKPVRSQNGDLYRGNGTLDSIGDVDDLLPPPFYTSEVVTNTSNPTWRHLDCSRFHLLDFVDVVHSFNICVWSCKQATNDTPLTPVLQYEIELTDLEYIGSELRQIGYYIFPQNSLIFELRDGLYVTRETRDNMRPSRITDVKPPALPDKRKASTCNQFAFAALITKRKNLQKAQEMGGQYSTAIEQKLGDHSSYFELIKQRDTLQLRLTQLKEECAAAKTTLKTDEEVLRSTRTELLPRSRLLARAQIALLASKQQLGNQESKSLDRDKEALKSIKESYEFRRWYLVNQIRTIYSIQQSVDGKSLSINGFRLPNSDFTGCDEEQIATALGYVSHILYLAAKYLEVPLRYPMIPMCSRSMILDEISQQTSPKFPLYSRGVDRTRFEYAVFLLNKNLEQLLNSQGLEIISLRHTLPNVQILLSKGQNN